MNLFSRSTQEKPTIPKIEKLRFHLACLVGSLRMYISGDAKRLKRLRDAVPISLEDWIKRYRSLENTWQRQTSLEHLSYYDNERAYEIVFAALYDHDRLVRITAIGILDRLGMKRIIAPKEVAHRLEPLLSDQDSIVSAHAFEVFEHTKFM